MRLEDILMSDDVCKSINDNMEYLLELIPEIKPCIGFLHNHPHHHLDVWNHTLLALSMSPNDFEIRLTLLLHDLGKPFSYQEGIDGVRHFKGHPLKSREIAGKILSRLNYPNDFSLEVLNLIEEHDTPMTEEDIKSNYSFAMKRFVVQECDCFAHKADKLENRIKYLNETNKLLVKYKKINL